MKKPSFIVAGVLVAGALLVFLSDPFSTLSRNDRNLVPKDLNRITVIEINGKEDTVLLEKLPNGYWLAGEEYAADQSRLRGLFDWLRRMEIQSVMSEKSPGINQFPVENEYGLVLSEGRKKIRKLRIRTGEGQDPRFLIRRGKTGKWILAGSYGKSLAPSELLETNLNDWRDKLLFSLDPSAIRSIELLNTRDSSAFFRLDYVPKQGFSLFDLSGDSIPGLNQGNAGRYYAYFMRVRLESYLSEKQWEELNNKTPLYELKVRSYEGGEIFVRMYPVPLREGGTEEEDPYRLYGTLPGRKEAFVIRYLDMDPLLKNRNYFIR